MRRLFFAVSTVLISIMTLLPIVPASATFGHPDTTNVATNAESKLLQFTSAGHVLGFREDGIIIASAQHVLKVNFLDSNAVTPKASGVVSEETNNGKAAPLGTVTYNNVWDGVTVVYEAGKTSVVKSTYYLDGANAESIRLGYNRPVQIDAQGDLVVSYEDGTIKESAPIAWQEIEGKKQPVTVAYSLLGEREIGFILGEYVAGVPVVIDPDLSWNTFLGGSGTDFGYALSIDDSGNMYVGGASSATWGTPIRAYTLSNDGFVAKFDNAGSLIWNTFLGGAGYDQIYSISLDNTGNIHVAGYSDATWGTPIRAYSSGNDGFVAKLDSSGALTWNTFLGGSGTDAILKIAVDGSGNVQIGGYSGATWGTPIRAYTSGYDGFVAKLDSSGALTWNTFLGGSGSDTGSSIVIDGVGNIYFDGRSGATWGTPIRAYSSGNDGFVAKLDSSGALTWNTFLGGSGSDFNFDIAVDDGKNVYVGGRSDATWGTPIRAYTLGTDDFVTKLDSSGALTWITFLGGSAADNGLGIALDGVGNIYIAGQSSATWGTPIRAYTLGIDGFAAKLNNDGTLIWNTFFGGSGDDAGRDIVVDTGGNVYITGDSTSTWGTPIQAYVASYDALVVKISNSIPVASSVTTTGTPKVGQVLTGSYTFSDTDGDTEGTSTFRWLRDGAAISLATALTYTTVLADLGTTTTFEVIPLAAAGTSTGVAATSSGMFIVNSAPVASAVSIAGTLNIGDTLNGHYTYSDVDSDAQGESAFRWLRDGIAIALATAQTYKLITADVGHSVTFEVTPIAATGVSTGTVVTSDSISANANIGGGGAGGTGALVLFNYSNLPTPVPIASSLPLTFTANTLVKLPDDRNPATQADSAVYYYGRDGHRHAFPNDKVFFTWYSDFSHVQIISATELERMPLGQNVTYRPGVKMVKFTTLSRVYAVDAGGLLRWVKTEAVATALYGSTWNKQIDDISDAFFTNYRFGNDIDSIADFNPSTVTAAASSIQVDMGF